LDLQQSNGMAALTLTEAEHAALQKLLLRKSPARVSCRAQALLWLAQGETPSEVSEVLNVSRQTLYNWVDRFEQRQDRDLISRLDDAPRSGRPPIALGIIDPLVEAVIDLDPREFGYHRTRWTAFLLQDYLKWMHGIDVSHDSVSHTIARIRVRWKRTRHTLALKAPTWGQQKGG
jgi:transposase